MKRSCWLLGNSISKESAELREVFSSWLSGDVADFTTENKRLPCLHFAFGHPMLDTEDASWGGGGEAMSARFAVLTGRG